MSVRVTFALGLSLHVAGGAADAQEPARPTLEEVRAVVEAAETAWLAAEAAAARAYSARRAARPVETDVRVAQAGPFRVAAAASRLSEATAAVEAAWADFAPFVDRPAQHFPDAIIVLWWEGDPLVDPAALGTALTPWQLYVRRSEWRHADPADVVRGAIDGELARLSGLEVGTVRAPRGERWVHRSFALAEGAAVEACRAGDPTACWGALGLGDGEPPWTDWALPREYASVLARIAAERVPLRLRGQRDGCLTAGREADCARVLGELSPELVASVAPVPLPRVLRQDLVGFALERGGPGSYSRLLPGGGLSPRERIAAAAGMDEDRLILEWVDRVTVAAGGRDQDSRRRRSAALLWYVLFLIPAARSTRWRLG